MSELMLIHIEGALDGEFTVTIANSKYSKSLEGAAGFPANAITRVIATTQRLFDPNADLKVNSRLKELVAIGANFLSTVAQLADNRELLKNEPAESEFAVMAKEEIARLEAAIKARQATKDAASAFFKS